MGEIADMTIDGTRCEQCGIFLDGDSPGYPRICSDCAEDAEIAKDYEGRIVPEKDVDDWLGV